MRTRGVWQGVTRALAAALWLGAACGGHAGGGSGTGMSGSGGVCLPTGLGCGPGASCCEATAACLLDAAGSSVCCVPNGASPGAKNASACCAQNGIDGSGLCLAGASSASATAGNGSASVGNGGSLGGSGGSLGSNGGSLGSNGGSLGSNGGSLGGNGGSLGSNGGSLGSNGGSLGGNGGSLGSSGGSLGGNGAGTGSTSAGVGGSTQGNGSATSAGMGTNGTGGCYSPILTHPLTDCAPGQVELLGELANYCSPSFDAPVTGGVSISDLNDPSVVAHIDCNLFYFCVSAGQTVLPLVNAAGFAETILPPIQATSSTRLDGPQGFELLCDQAVTSLQGQFQQPPYDSSRAMVFVSIESDYAQSSSWCNAPSGWVFTVTDSQGNALSDAGLNYLADTSLDAGSQTNVFGTAILWDVDPAVGSITLSADNPGFDDAGTPCPYVGASAHALTLTVPVQAGLLTFIPYDLP